MTIERSLRTYALLSTDSSNNEHPFYLPSPQLAPPIANRGFLSALFPAVVVKCLST